MTTILAVGATGQVGRVVVTEALERGLQVRALTRDAVRAASLLPAAAEVVEADSTDPRALAPLVADVDAVVLTHGGDRDLEHVYYGTVAAVLKALADRPEVYISLMTSMYVSTPNHEQPEWDWKRRAERLVRVSTHPYTIVRPGWFDYQGPHDTQIDLRQGDRTSGQPGVDRRHIAQVLLEAFHAPSGEHRTIEVFSAPGARPWSRQPCQTCPPESKEPVVTVLVVNASSRRDGNTTAMVARLLNGPSAASSTATPWQAASSHSAPPHVVSAEILHLVDTSSIPAARACLETSGRRSGAACARPRSSCGRPRSTGTA